jgi:hypothetical protein
MCGGYIDGDGGDEGKNKGAEVKRNIFNNQGLEAAMEDSGGVARMGAITTNDNGACDTSSLNNFVHVQ